MSKAYPSNLSQAQYEFLRDLLPEAKPGGRPRETELWEILNAIFYLLVEGVQWRSPNKSLSGQIHQWGKSDGFLTPCTGSCLWIQWRWWCRQL